MKPSVDHEAQGQGQQAAQATPTPPPAAAHGSPDTEVEEDLELGDENEDEEAGLLSTEPQQAALPCFPAPSALRQTTATSQAQLRSELKAYYDNVRVTELRRQLKLRSLTVYGKKSELVKRLIDNMVATSHGEPIAMTGQSSSQTQSSSNALRLGAYSKPAPRSFSSQSVVGCVSYTSSPLVKPASAHPLQISSQWNVSSATSPTIAAHPLPHRADTSHTNPSQRLWGPGPAQWQEINRLRQQRPPQAHNGSALTPTSRDTPMGQSAQLRSSFSFSSPSSCTATLPLSSPPGLTQHTTSSGTLSKLDSSRWPSRVPFGPQPEQGVGTGSKHVTSAARQLQLSVDTVGTYSLPSSPLPPSVEDSDSIQLFQISPRREPAKERFSDATMASSSHVQSAFDTESVCSDAFQSEFSAEDMAFVQNVFVDEKEPKLAQPSNVEDGRGPKRQKMDGPDGTSAVQQCPQGYQHMTELLSKTTVRHVLQVRSSGSGASRIPLALGHLQTVEEALVLLNQHNLASAPVLMSTRPTAFVPSLGGKPAPVVAGTFLGMFDAFTVLKYVCKVLQRDEHSRSCVVSASSNGLCATHCPDCGCFRWATVDSTTLTLRILAASSHVMTHKLLAVCESELESTAANATRVHEDTSLLDLLSSVFLSRDGTKQRLHRVPVFNSAGCVVDTVSACDVLRHLTRSVNFAAAAAAPDSSFKAPIQSLGWVKEFTALSPSSDNPIGAPSKWLAQHSVAHNVTVASVLPMLCTGHSHSLSAHPSRATFVGEPPVAAIVDAKFRLFGNVSEDDFRGLTAGSLDRLALPVLNFVLQPPRTYTCRLEDSFSDVLSSVLSHHVHRLFVVDSQQHALSQITATDVLRTLLSLCGSTAMPLLTTASSVDVKPSVQQELLATPTLPPAMIQFPTAPKMPSFTLPPPAAQTHLSNLSMPHLGVGPSQGQFPPVFSQRSQQTSFPQSIGVKRPNQPSVQNSQSTPGDVFDVPFLAQ